MSENIIVAIITGLITLVGAFLMALPGIKAFKSAKRKSDAETAKTDAEASKIFSDLAVESVQREIRKEVERSEVVSMLNKRIDEIEGEFKNVIDIVFSWAKGIGLLITQIEEKEDCPNWKPSQEDIDYIRNLKESRRH